MCGSRVMEWLSEGTDGLQLLSSNKGRRMYMMRFILRYCWPMRRYPGLVYVLADGLKED